MPKTITFNELRRIKASLPEGSTHVIAEKLNLSVQTVRNYFGGSNYDFGIHMGVHIEPGPDGGIVVLDDPTILDMALEILDNQKFKEKV
ncbi:MAG: DNA-binding protein [Muribaculaceae bacterium]|nr:DNA-binding protein [Muribaculaceae bacterium]